MEVVIRLAQEIGNLDGGLGQRSNDGLRAIGLDPTAIAAMPRIS